MLGQSVAAPARTAPTDRPPSYLQFLFVAGGLQHRRILVRPVAQRLDRGLDQLLGFKALGKALP